MSMRLWYCHGNEDFGRLASQGQGQLAYRSIQEMAKPPKHHHGAQISESTAINLNFVAGKGRKDRWSEKTGC